MVSEFGTAEHEEVVDWPLPLYQKPVCSHESGVTVKVSVPAGNESPETLPLA